ncbi:unnamed protein product [Spirodela intermedia]|uniref:Uncharacterized protein n=1 Tax=Spirodela intermedia TaxID=51605 RepID=A0ABN7EA45_SPIIN|nr:unnamed protein product [Spirodela intermedia]
MWGHVASKRLLQKISKSCTTCQATLNISKRDAMSLQLILERSMKWVIESSPAAVTWRSEKIATLQLSGSCHPMEKSWMESLSRTCTTTPCSTVGWPPVMWKGGGAHVPLSV